MRRKKIAVWLLALLLLGMAGCTRPVEETVKTTTVGICLRQGSDPETAAYRQLLEAALTRKGYTLVTVDGQNDQSKQNAQLEQMLEDGCDLVILEPVMLSEMEAVAERLRQADVPAVIVGREPDEAVLESWEKLCFVGSDATQPGLMQGQIVLEQPRQGDVNEDGVVSYIVLAGPEDHIDAQLRSEYCGKELTFAGVQINQITLVNGDWTRQSGKVLCAQALATYGVDIEVVFCNNDDMALGALDAIQSGGWTVGKDMYLVGVGGETEALTAIKGGEMTGTVRGDMGSQVDKVAEIVQRLLAGEKVQRKYYIDYVKITAQNVSTFE